MLAERIREWPERFKQEGIEVGEERHALQVARRMIDQGFSSDEIIAEIAGMDVARVAALRREIETGNR
ncbi:hypothetical protein A8U91_04007 [Halomonas elongata]|uniref:Transposase n=1 Tax=Halomonas elongata TaxID=2746 RepID=A0A1B8NY78_HALEL|nr:hypothetical protein [Halomonas elongata]OBX34944.1 hypothetical protein A8U91_04007 [Halomonas elongata]